MEGLREHNNFNACNHRRPISSEHRAAFPEVDFGAVDPVGPAHRAEWLDDASYKDSFAFVRARAAKVLDEFAALPDREIVAFTHGTFIRALQCEVLGLNCHHFGACPPTGTPTEVRLIEVTATGERYWELGDQDAKVQNLSKNAPTSRPRVSRVMTHGG